MRRSESSRNRWTSIAGRVVRQFFRDRLTTAASSVAFYALLGSVPALAVAILIYGEFADPLRLQALAKSLHGLVPPNFADMLSQQVSRLADQQSSNSGVSAGSVGWLVLMTWSANRGMMAFVDALNIIYDRVEQRGFLQQIAISLTMTIAAIAFMTLAIAGVIVWPAALRLLNIDGASSRVLDLGRWPVLLLITAFASALLLRFGPSRAENDWGAIVIGSIVSATLWVSASILFFWYARNLANFSAIYGSLGTIIAIMTWLWLSALAVLIGAEVDAACTCIDK
ncbi:MAG: YihY/virulence factor BrkB family protein [Tardiphaga sp.]|nr:YihY/virulence factor BrkB family protein [Tardiphaga sp.]